MKRRKVSCEMKRNTVAPSEVSRMDSQAKNIFAAPQCILVVDDEVHIRELVAESLSLMGHRVTTAEDGLDAIEKIQNGSFDIIITDLDMPRMDGLELIKAVHADHKNIDTIAITGHAVKYKYTEVIGAGAADFITKPFSLDKLEAKLQRLLRERWMRRELEELAIRDPLTGLFNRRHFKSILTREAVRAIRYGHPLYLFFIDIDSFKDYNDQKGHQAGDQLLILLADILRTSIREHVDTAFRYGGDEFCVILPHLKTPQAVKVAERIRAKYNKLKPQPTTLSTGIASFSGNLDNLAEAIEDLVQRADRALYEAKQARGGDCVCVNGIDPPEPTPRLPGNSGTGGGNPR